MAKIELSKEDLNKAERQRSLNILGSVDESRQNIVQGLSFFESGSGVISFKFADNRIKNPGVNRDTVPLCSLQLGRQAKPQV